MSGITAEFEKVFAKAGMKLSDKANLMRVAEHSGPHSMGYHNYVMETLRSAVKGLSGADYKQALVGALSQLSTEISKNPGILRMP